MQTRDGGYIITGSTSSIGGVNGDVFLIKIDSVGTETWSKTFGGDGFDAGFSVQQTRDGGYIVAGLIHLFNPSSSGVYLIKTDASGATVWTKTFGGALSYEGYSVQQTTDGGYIVTGYIQPLSSSDVGAFLIKTDENGDVK
jgi:hypothetical protein